MTYPPHPGHHAQPGDQPVSGVPVSGYPTSVPSWPQPPVRYQPQAPVYPQHAGHLYPPPPAPPYPPPYAYPPPPYGQRHPQQPVHVQIGRTVTTTGLGTGVHMVHLVLTLCTFGLWAPVWIGHALMSQRRSVSRPG